MPSTVRASIERFARWLAAVPAAVGELTVRAPRGRLSRVDNLMPILAVVGIIALAIVLGVISVLQAKKRREMFAQFPASNGWTWMAEDERFANRWNGTPFGEGDHRKASNVVWGTWRDRPVLALDYSYTTHTTDGQGHRTTTIHRYGVCAVGIPIPLPRLEVTHEGMLTRLGSALGFTDIELESEDFNRKFRVSCPDRKFASDVLHPRMMAMLLQKGTVAWRMEGTDLLCWDCGQHSPVLVLERLSLLDDILDGIPSFVWHDRGVAPETTGEPSP